MYVKTKCLLTWSHKIRTSWLTTLNKHILFRIMGGKNELHSRHAVFLICVKWNLSGHLPGNPTRQKISTRTTVTDPFLPFTWQNPPGLEKFSSPTLLLSERSFCFFQEIFFWTTLHISEWLLPLPFWLCLEVSYGFSPFLRSLESQVSRWNIHITCFLLFQTYLGMNKWWVCILVQVQNSEGVTTLIV